MRNILRNGYNRLPDSLKISKWRMFWPQLEQKLRLCLCVKCRCFGRCWIVQADRHKMWSESVKAELTAMITHRKISLSLCSVFCLKQSLSHCVLLTHRQTRTNLLSQVYGMTQPFNHSKAAFIQSLYKWGRAQAILVQKFKTYSSMCNAIYLFITPVSALLYILKYTLKLF